MIAWLIFMAALHVDRSVAQQPPSDAGWCVSFHEVHPSMSAQDARLKGVPADFQIYPIVPDAGGGELLLRAEPVLHGGDMSDAWPGTSADVGAPVVSFHLKAAGALKLATFTREHVGQKMAIAIDGKVVSAPVIREPITGGAGQITGNLTPQDAAQLASRIRTRKCK
jgi:preprotein translocase subunit SecD